MAGRQSVADRLEKSKGLQRARACVSFKAYAKQPLASGHDAPLAVTLASAAKVDSGTVGKRRAYDGLA